MIIYLLSILVQYCLNYILDIVVSYISSNIFAIVPKNEPETFFLYSTTISPQMLRSMQHALSPLP